jgi:hypothetical protein
LKELSETRFPRLVQQIWGFEPAESRTHYLCRDATLSTAGAGYRTMDIPLSADLPGPREGVRCYFIPDGRHDPYGKIKIQESKAHAKTLHLTPFWAAAQRRVDALGVAIYRDKDAPPDTQTLESHFVMPRDVDGFWIGNRLLAIPEDRPWEFPLKPGEALVLRKGTAAVGVRVPWARGLDGQRPPVALIYDTNTFGAVRLTVAHQSEKKANAGAAFWVRIGSGLVDDAAFEKWRREFAAARADTEVAGDRVRVSVAGADGAVTVGADAAKSAAFALEPPPSRALLAVDGDDIGKRLLENLEPIRSWRGKRPSQQRVALPKGKSICWEAETGRVIPPMTPGSDAGASGGLFVWMPGKPGEAGSSSVGRVTWQLAVPTAGRYFVWGRVQTPTPSDDSFNVRVFSDGAEIAGLTSWQTGVHKDWSWVPLAFDGARKPAALALPQGTVYLQLRVREDGAKIDRLFLTMDEKQQPK